MKKAFGLIELLCAICVIGVLVVVLMNFLIQPYMESMTYNKLTGAKTTTWDAMWVELRVQDQASTNKDNK